MLNNALRVHATVTIGTTRPFIAFFLWNTTLDLHSIRVDELRVALLPLMRRILHAVLLTFFLSQFHENSSPGCAVKMSALDVCQPTCFLSHIPDLTRREDLGRASVLDTV